MAGTRLNSQVTPVASRSPIQKVIGPMAAKARKPVTSRATGATTSRWKLSFTFSLSQISTLASTQAATSMGSICPW